MSASRQRMLSMFIIGIVLWSGIIGYHVWSWPECRRVHTFWYCVGHP